MVCEARAGPAHNATTSPPAFLFQLESLFQRVCVRLIDLETQVVLLNLQRPFASMRRRSTSVAW